MNIRRRGLPPGWYPGSESSTKRAIERMMANIEKEDLNGLAGVVPHAGWDFSGEVSLRVMSALDSTAQTVVVIGGHLHPSDANYAAKEDMYETPIGLIKADIELLKLLETETELAEDRYTDNTVEIQLPLVRYMFPEAKVLWLRSSPSERAIKLGNALARCSKKLDRRIIVLGSTDLTHYGLNYGFMPMGLGKSAVEWVKNVNDREFLDLLLSFKAEEAIRHAVKNKSACSAGAAVAALTYAKETGRTKSKLVAYKTSYDVYPGESFVGYGGIVYY